MASNVINVAPQVAAPETAASFSAGALTVAPFIAAIGAISLGDQNPVNQLLGLSGGEYQAPNAMQTYWDNIVKFNPGWAYRVPAEYRR